MGDFNSCVRDVDLVEHPHSGSLYTWCRNWGDHGMLRVLDRVLCNHQGLINSGQLKHYSFNGIVKECWEKKVTGSVNCKIYGGDLDPNVLTEVVNLNSVDGDTNTNYFHKNMIIRQAKNRITQMHNRDVVLTDKYDEVKAIIMEYYKEFFAAKKNNVCNKAEVVRVLKKNITAEQGIRLCRTITERKIEDVMLGMKKGKAPGPDGFSYEFYSYTWPVIKMSVVEAVQTFFTTSKMPK
ncbi:hypothetical protein LIER_40797 [Lithospermum erythrorhizon]|uniref:Uncharacterized protein n=1 Tax=Lithospermum erythrorhizon TaxID=34254 RepID=A0AAV3R302_LITER